ncbi:MAG: class I SAM-dependent methyltransferase [Bacteroidales bacterium]|nr:class I SAM-dependent methyltransferase [Bacteroidales bacterium]
MLSSRFKNDGKSIYKLNEIQLQAKADIELKIAKEQYKFEEINCSSCGSKSYELLAEKDRYGLKYYTRICKDCGFVYVSPRMTEESYAEFYNNEYRKLYVGENIASEKFYEDQVFRGKRIFQFINSHYELNNKKLDILEVGCGAGGILSVFKENGHNITGIDLGEEYLNYGKEKHKLNLIKTSLKDIDENYKADIIIYSHVFEHILNLEKELNTIKEHLKENGIIYIEVPGIKYVHKTYEMNFLKYLQNAHVYHFSLNSLSRILQKNNFNLVYGDEQIRTIFKLKIDIEDKVFKNEYSTVLEYLTKIEKMRVFNIFRFKKIRWKIKKLFLKLIFK